MRVLLVGNGAREHAIAESLIKKNNKVELISFVTAKNPGIIKLSREYVLSKLDDFEVLGTFVKEFPPDFAVIGPEAPLEAGIVDFLDILGIPCVGPLKELAQLETSKSFTRNIMTKYKIPGCPKYKIFQEIKGISEYIDALGHIVIKPDGLTAGKGVRVQGEHFNTKEEALRYCEEVLKVHQSVILEDKLEGEEFSLQSFCDGKTVIDCPPVQDHKRAYNDDKGPNTGGMGSYSCENHLLPFMTNEHLEQAHKITVEIAKALYKETGKYYKGIMYGGFIITKEGVKLIEYNSRFGDPEAMNVLPLLKNNFIDVCKAIIDGRLNKLGFEKFATVCKYAVPRGYPKNPVKGKKVDITQIQTNPNLKIYYASIDEKDNNLYMTGSRAIAFLGMGHNLNEAEIIAQTALDKVIGPIEYRNDIGTKQLIQKRINHIKTILDN